MINLHHISKIYKSNSVETHALSNVSLEVAEGEFVSIMGPSGCGKTTLLNIMGLLDGFDQGLYVFDSTDVKKLNEKSRVKLRKSNIGFIFQNFNLLDDLTVFENIELPLVYLGVKAAERRERVKQVLHQIALGHRMDHFPHQLSGGQQQKVAIGRAIVSKPRIILADEPTGNLDSAQGNEIMETLSSLNEAGTTLVMVTHSMNDASYSNRIVKLMDGQIVAEKALLHA
ncbi:ABC-type antimicrobial peptide transport system, ATPase component [Owenweeksia hongkongensis DSM 17368]|uniref:ABC-type antimicrobial peptide transport system, ATPase component n=1 Tax=Owenweeksia hongkongensis (strain DSM 17368 / CIP 108786 / JCM 12287 / NRRL B-23963 / UST20020801) TaxID=926562 RepID=G8QZN9_OWEHD|nr:ABC transporter ATP-binding protein [Owenweeksia hongkongensis]AEV33692.1 ABC-type antimicrobial peptide transport system, ATPase component [Owenweeksia hongkongensis DSM 17368]